MTSHHRSILLTEYMDQVAPTDKMDPHDLKPILLGLFGEVGSIMATAKKYHREGEAYAGYRSAVEEEFGDALWYLTAFCRRVKLRVDELLGEATRGDQYTTSVAANDLLGSPISHVATPLAVAELDPALFRLGEAAANLFAIEEKHANAENLLAKFADLYVRALNAARVSFAEVVRKNIAKTRGRFLPPDYSKLPTFDGKFEEYERLPAEFRIVIDQRKSGRSYLRWNNVFIGDPLTDNILDPDGYRFHDVFHFAYAAVLYWSPVFRALIKQKRKSDPKFDEAQDGGRAIVVEEGLTAWIFARAKEVDYFANQTSLSFDLLKTVQQFVAGYEVQECPLNLWETAILEGYKVFRQVRDNSGGIVIGNRKARTIAYEPLSGGKG